MTQQITSIKSEAFLKAVLEDLEPLQGTFIYEASKTGHLEKVSQGYSEWLQKLIPYLIEQFNLKKQDLKILDFGCGTGELTVILNKLGYQTTGIDLHEKHLALAKILARENGLAEDIFVLNRQTTLPFADNSFDIIILAVVLEHLDNQILEKLLPELHRICAGVVYILVPNKWQTVDDHTGLRFVSWLPRAIAERYIRWRGERYRYAISDSGVWDVYYRTFGQVISVFKRFKFDYHFVADEVVYPALDVAAPLFTYNGLHAPTWKKPIYFGLGTIRKTILKSGYPEKALYPYLNLVFLPVGKKK